MTPWQRTSVLVVALLLGACGRSGAPATAVGTLEMDESEMALMQPARVLRVLVREGDRVRAGDTVAVCTIPTLSASALQAEARLAAARELATEATRGSRPEEIARATAEFQAVEAEAQRAAADLQRLAPWAERGVVSRQQLDAAQAMARTTANRRDAARQALALVREGPRAERRAAANADVRQAAAAAAGVAATARDLVLLAPVDGLVTSRNVEPGEILGAGQSAVTIGQPTRPWARIFVSQFVLARLRVGDTLVARLDGDTTAWHGRILSIASTAEFTPRVALTEQERADLLFAVKLGFTDPEGRLHPGVPVTVQLPTTTPTRATNATGPR